MKSAAALSAAVLMATAAGSASAASFTPNPVSGFTMSGMLNISQTTTVDCSVTMTGDIASGGATATITNVSVDPGSWHCGWYVTASGTPWIVLPTSTSSVMIWMGFAAPSTCSGATTASWTNGSPSAATFSSASLPGSPGCTLFGTVTASHSVTII